MNTVFDVLYQKDTNFVFYLAAAVASFTYIDNTPSVVGRNVLLRLSFSASVVGAMCGLVDSNGNVIRSPEDCE